MTPITLQHVQQALRLPDFDARSAWATMRMRPDLRRELPQDRSAIRQAGVLVLIYPLDGALSTVLIRRAPDPGVHSGQIGFPGGSWEPADPDYTATALREACEEVGICAQDVTVLGRLTEVYIPPSQFLVWPAVGSLPVRPAFKPNPEEVAELLELPLHNLLDEAARRETDMHLAGMTFRVPYYDVQGHVVWGATALMLSELAARLRVVIAG